MLRLRWREARSRSSLELEVEVEVQSIEYRVPAACSQYRRSMYMYAVTMQEYLHNLANR